MPTWYTCAVTRAGPAEDGTVYVALTDVSGSIRFTNRWFKATDSTKRLILKTALCAVAADKRAQCSLSDIVEHSTILRFYIIAVAPAPPLPCEQYCEPAFARAASTILIMRLHGDNFHADQLENFARQQLLACLTQNCPSADVPSLMSQISMRYLGHP